MSSKSNLYKYHRVNLQEDEARVIDYNERIAEKIAMLSQSLQETMEDDYDEGFADGFSDGLDAEQVSALLDDNGGTVIKAEPVYEGPSPEELLAEAQEQIDQMMASAMAEAESIKGRAYEEGHMQGYNDGISKGRQEMAMESDRLAQEYAAKDAQLTALYQQRLEEIEPQLVDVLTDIYEHVFQVAMSDQRDLIIHLIGNTLRKTEGSSEYLIHISPEDLPFVSMQKAEILEAGGVINASVEFIEDMTLKKNQCLIETDGGIFDCSLGVELKELKKQLLLLSYDGVQRG